MGKGIARMYSNTHLFTSMHFAMNHPTHYVQEHKILKTSQAVQITSSKACHIILISEDRMPATAISLI